MLDMFLAQAPAAPLEVPSVDYAAVLPMLIVFGVACIGVLVEAFAPKATRWGIQVAISSSRSSPRGFR